MKGDRIKAHPTTLTVMNMERGKTAESIRGSGAGKTLKFKTRMHT
jgi:hypothetical protein